VKSQAFEVLKNIRTGRFDGYVKPHKFALLLSIIELYKRNPNRKNRFQLDAEMEKLFESKFRELASNAPYSSAIIEYPFYHLQGDGCWFLHVRSGKESEYHEIKQTKSCRFTKKRLLDIFSHASLSEDYDRIFRESSTRGEAEKMLYDIFNDRISVNKSSKSVFANKDFNMAKATNPFIGYLNSLQRSGGSNENALAESQACNTQFASIHVAHPLADIIYEELRAPNGRHVILTGHAGDGKSPLRWRSIND